MIFSRIYLLPPLLFLLLVGNFIITYIIAVALKHVRPDFPYISDTGTVPPESTIFSQLLNIGAVLTYILFYVRCHRVKKLYSDPKLPWYAIVTRLNRISLWISLPTALGISMVGNFQQSNAIIPHIIGAILCFLSALIYFWIHTVISYTTYPVLNTLNMARFRVLIVIISSLACGGTVLFGVISFLNFQKTLYDLPHWGPDDGGYDLHVVSTVSEWLTVLFYGIYILTFVKEFKDIVIQNPKVEIVNHAISQQTNCDTRNDSINPLDNVDGNSNEDRNGNFGKAVNIERGGSKLLLV